MDVAKFLAASFSPREAVVEVPALAEFFGEDTPRWVVRGLTASELARANEASANTASIRRVVQSLAAGNDKAETVMNALGLVGEDTPADISRRIEMLTSGSVAPALGVANRDVAVVLAERFPVQFFELTNRILELTGQGAELGKPKRSGKSPKSD